MWFAKDYLAIHYLLFVIIYDLDNLITDIMALSITVALFFVAIWVLTSWKLVTIFYDQNKLYKQKLLPLKLSTYMNN